MKVVHKCDFRRAGKSSGGGGGGRAGGPPHVVMSRDDPRHLGPGSSRPLWERIEAGVLERIEEAVDAFCLDLLVRSRRERGRPMPVADSPTDRAEFETLVGAFLRHLRTAMGDGGSEAEGAEDAAVEARTPAEGHARLLATQVALARRLPDYWKRFEAAQSAFASDALASEAGRSGWLDRLFRRAQ
jgi:hypothetical protein